MTRLIYIIAFLSLSSCAVYKVETQNGFKTNAEPESKLVVAKVNGFPEGFQCFEPMLYVLSLGIIPAHCVNTYNVSTEAGELGQVKVTSMQGWLMILMAPLPSWKVGYGSNVELEVLKASHGN